MIQRDLGCSLEPALGSLMSWLSLVPSLIRWPLQWGRSTIKCQNQDGSSQWEGMWLEWHTLLCEAAWFKLHRISPLLFPPPPNTHISLTLSLPSPSTAVPMVVATTTTPTLSFVGVIVSSLLTSTSQAVPRLLRHCSMVCFSSRRRSKGRRLSGCGTENNSVNYISITSSLHNIIVLV